MASNEKQFKAELTERAREQGGHVVVVAGSYLAGIPDLYIKMPGLPGAWIELKFTNEVKGGRYRNMLTPLQRLFIRNHQHAGGEAFWLLCVRTNNGRLWALYGHVDPDVDRMDERHYLMNRAYGQKWDVEKIFHMVGVLPEEVRYGR